MITVNIHEIKANLSRYLAMVEKGERVIIARRNVPVAELGAIRKKQSKPKGKRLIGGYPHKLDIPDSAFFDPLPDDILEAFTNPK